MGEKIRDLQPIHIGKAELMIELNEGYIKNEGRLIHIQDKHFRYLLKEKEFLKMAGAVLRSKREMDYIKCDASVDKNQKVHVDCLDASKAVKDIERELKDIFTKENIRYRIVSDGAEYITILIHQDDKKKSQSCFDAFGMREIDHPYTEKAGYIYLYQMNPFKLFIFRGIYIEVYFQLPCMSLTPKNWIPLDRAIQSHIWNCEVRDEDECIVLDAISKVIFLCGWSIFTTHYFSIRSREYIEAHIEVLQQEETMRLMKTVFFNFTDELKDLLIDRQYDQVLESFYRFDKY